MLRRFFIVAALAASLFCGAASAAGQSGDPAGSVAMLQKAIDTNDMALAEQYMDIDGVIAKGIESVIVDENIMREGAKHPAINMALALGPKTGNEILRALLSSEAREYVRHGIVSGAFAGNPRADAPPYRGIFPKAFRGGDKDKRSFGAASVTMRSGDTAHVRTTLVEGRKNAVHPLDLVMQKRDGVWRVVEVANTAALFRAESKAK